MLVVFPAEKVPVRGRRAFWHYQWTQDPRNIRYISTRGEFWTFGPEPKISCGLQPFRQKTLKYLEQSQKDFFSKKGWIDNIVVTVRKCRRLKTTMPRVSLPFWNQHTTHLPFADHISFGTQFGFFFVGVVSGTPNRGSTYTGSSKLSLSADIESGAVVSREGGSVNLAVISDEVQDDNDA